MRLACRPRPEQHAHPHVPCHTNAAGDSALRRINGIRPGRGTSGRVRANPLGRPKIQIHQRGALSGGIHLTAVNFPSMPAALRESGSAPLPAPARRRVALAANRETVILGGIVAAAVVVRFATLGHQSYDHDEAVTAWRVLRGGLGGTLNVVANSERSPPLYYVLAWGWAQLFGTGEVGLRSLSALIGVATVPAAYLAARELVSGRAGLVAAALVAFNPYLVWYSQEARSYALLVLFVAWGLYFFARCLNDASRRNLAMWGAASALALCSHYFAVFIVAAEGLWLVVRGWPRRGPVVALGATAAVGLALLPLAVAQEGSGRRNHFASVSIVHRAAGMVVEFMGGPEPGGLVGSPVGSLLPRRGRHRRSGLGGDRPRSAPAAGNPSGTAGRLDDGRRRRSRPDRPVRPRRGRPRLRGHAKSDRRARPVAGRRRDRLRLRPSEAGSVSRAPGRRSCSSSRCSAGCTRAPRCSDRTGAAPRLRWGGPPVRGSWWCRETATSRSPTTATRGSSGRRDFEARG